MRKLERHFSKEINFLKQELESYNGTLLENKNREKNVHGETIHTHFFSILFTNSTIKTNYIALDEFFAKETAFKAVKASFDAIKHTLKKAEKIPA